MDPSVDELCRSFNPQGPELEVKLNSSALAGKAQLELRPATWVYVGLKARIRGPGEVARG